MLRSLVGSEMCIRDSPNPRSFPSSLLTPIASLTSFHRRGSCRSPSSAFSVDHRQHRLLHHLPRHLRLLPSPPAASPQLLAFTRTENRNPALDRLCPCLQLEDLIPTTSPSSTIAFGSDRINNPVSTPTLNVNSYNLKIIIGDRLGYFTKDLNANTSH